MNPHKERDIYMSYVDMSTSELETLKAALETEYASHCAKGLSLNMARGKPGCDQLALSLPMLDELTSSSGLIAEDGTDCRNYGVMDGIAEAKRLMGEVMEHDPANVCVFGNSSLNIMFDLVTAGYTHGYLGSTPWCKLPEVKWLCPVPGYDRHFGITESYGIEMIPISMNENGPDMDEIERLVAEDDSIKGIWCVPQYANPTGITYSNETVHRLAEMSCAASDFRIFWDNAYCVHHLYDDEREHVADIAAACEAAGNPNRYFKFASTSKVTLPGAGIAAVAASAENIAEIKARVGVQTVGYDKMNQLRHVRFLPTIEAVKEHMKKHAEFLRPRFEAVERKLTEGLGDTDCATWTHPRGGYFVSFDGPEGSAQKVAALCADLGVKLTPAGATWPYGKDPRDTNIRIAPSYPTVEDLEAALDVLVLAVKLVAAELARAERA